MGDPHVDRWRQRGNISMWQNYRPLDAWNLTANDVACDAICALLDLMLNAQWSSKKELRLRKPRVVAGHSDKFAKIAKSLTIKYPKGQVPEEYWRIEETGSGVLLEVGEASLRQLREAIVDLKGGGGDYCIGGAERQRLFVWWYLDD